MPDPGEVFYLPPEEHEPAEKGARPHVVLGLPRSDIDTVTLAYTSTKRNDAAFGAEHVLIDPFAAPYRGTGLVRPTYVYPSRLVVWPAEEIMSRSCAGRIIDEMSEIRASLVRALGFGTGVTHEPNRIGSNRRGRVVELSPDVAAEWEVGHAVILTEPNYSRYGYQQTVVPLLDDSVEATSLDVEVGDTAWLSTLGNRYRTVSVAVPLVATAYQPTSIARYLDVVVPAEVMTRVERALAAHFGLGLDF